MAVGGAEVTAVQWGDLRFGLLKGGPGSVLQHPREPHIAGYSVAHMFDSLTAHAGEFTLKVSGDHFIQRIEAGAVLDKMFITFC